VFDCFGEYHYCPLAREHDLHFFDTSGTEIKVDIDSCLDRYVYEANHCYLIANTETVTPCPQMVKPTDVDYEWICPLLGWLSLQTVSDTFKATMQYCRMPMSAILKKHFKSPFPALNVFHRNELVATFSMSVSF
jgi:hypothetical protein